MPWVKLDDGFPFNRKAILAGKDGRALYVTALCWTSGQLTDGHIDDAAVPMLAAVSEVTDAQGAADHLAAIGLWERVQDGYEIHDYHDYNPSSGEVRAMREARAQAGRRGGLATQASKAEANAQANAEQDSEHNPTPFPFPSPFPIPDPDHAERGAVAPPPSQPEAVIAPVQEPDTEPKRANRTDPRTKHPAIALVKGITGKNPPRALYDRIILIAGEHPDGAKAADCYRAWCERGYNPNAMTWLTEWYPNGIPKGPRNGNGSGGLAGFDAQLERFGEEG